VKPTPPPAPAANPALAGQLRSAGLNALNQGQVARAVALLTRAAQLDPANPLIARDLARAERIARAVQAKR
jgi:Flp pilus assembly protein TadD